MNAEPSTTDRKSHDGTIGTVLRTLVLCDLADSTTLVERLGDKTAAELIRRHDRLARVAVQRHGGREIDKTDGFLLLFERPIEAVAFALEYQRGLRALAEEAKQPLSARVGIHVGEVLVWDNVPADVVRGAKPMEVEGLAKPVAARLMGLALPGQILLSAVAQTLAQRGERELDPRAGGLRWLAHGRYHFKGVPEPLMVYEVGEPGIAPLRAPHDSPKAWRTKPWWRRPAPVAAAMSALLAITVSLYIYGPWKTTAPSRAPVVAVLPLTASDGSPDEQALADELTRELSGTGSTSASLIGWVSRDLAASYKDKPIEPRKVGRELGATHLLEGEIRRVDEGRVQLRLQLIDAANGTPVWSDRFEIPKAGTTKDMTAAFVSRLAMWDVYKAAFFRRFAGPPGPNATPAELVWHGGAIMYSNNNTVAAAVEARRWFDQALRLDPNYPPAIRSRWRTLEYEFDFAPKPDVGRILREMDELSFRAVSIEGTNRVNWEYRTVTLLLERRYDAALEASDKAGFSSDAVGWTAIWRARIMLQLGQPEKTIALADRAASDMNSESAGWAMLQRCAGCMALGLYDEAIAACEKDVALDDWWLPHLYLVAGYALKGNAAKAAGEEAAVLELRPGTSIADFKTLYWSDNPAFVQQTEAHLLTGLRKAGFPEK